MQVTQDDHLTISRRQTDDRPSDLLNRVPLQDVVEGRPGDDRRAQGRPVVVRVAERQKPALATQPSPRHVPSHAVHVCAERGLPRIVPPRVAQHREERLLRNVFGDRLTAAHLQRKPEDRALPG